MGDSVEQICKRAQAGCRESATALLGSFYAQIFAYLRRISGDSEEAADLTQKTFAKAWAALPSYQARSRFSTWLHAIAHHVYVDWRRQRKPGTSQTDEWWAAQSAPISTPFEDAAERDLALRLYALVERLEEEARQVLHLHYYQELSIAETAEVLGVSGSTVKYRLRAALEQLRSRMGDPSDCLPDGKSQPTRL